MIVYGSSVSPYVRKVVAFAAEKGLEIKVKGVTLGSQEPHTQSSWRSSTRC
jgi:glutathione S-transferase